MMRFTFIILSIDTAMVHIDVTLVLKFSLITWDASANRIEINAVP